MAGNVFVRPFRAMLGASWLYPLKGLVYFVGHPYLWPLLRGRLLPCFLLSIFVLGNLFFWTYIPQVLFLMIWHGPTAWLNGTFLVLGEGAAIVAILFESFFVDEAQVDIFDAVLVDRGLENLVAASRPVADSGPNALQRLGKPTRSAIYGPFSLRQILEFIIFLPLNFIPIAGVPMFLLLTGYRAGPLQHWRYFKLLGMDKRQRNAAIKKRRWKYTWFGTVALLLQLVPVLSMFFLLTTAAGSALWVVKLEEEKMLQEQRQAEGPSYTDDPPDYTDDPV